MDFSQVSYTDKSIMYKELDKMVREAKEKNYDYSSELARMNLKLGKASLNFKEFETIARSMNPLITSKNVEFLAELIKEKQSSRISVSTVELSRLLDKIDLNRENLSKFFDKIKAYHEKQGSTPDKTFQEFQNSATNSIGPTELDKMIRNFHYSMEGVDVEMLFMSINGFESDFKISDKQWVSSYNEQIERDTKLKPQTSQRSQNGMEQNLKEIYPILHKLKNAMLKQGIDKLKIILEKERFQSKDGKMTPVQFKAAVRDVMPTLTYMELDELSEKFTSDNMIVTDVPDQYIRESSRFNTSNMSNLT